MKSGHYPVLTACSKISRRFDLELQSIFPNMRFVAPSAKLSRLAALAAVILFSLTSYGQTRQATEPGKSDQVVNLLIPGDSISWGQGLKEEHKAWFLVKKWLELNTGRIVHAQVEAHSGAVIGEPTPSGLICARTTLGW